MVVDKNKAPLAGITIVGIEQAVSAPMCTRRRAADFGARVIKVENPKGGDFARDYDDVVNGPNGLAAHFVWVNRGKESVTLDLKSPVGMDTAIVCWTAPMRWSRTSRRARPPGWGLPPRISAYGILGLSPSRSTATAPAGRYRTRGPTTC